MTSEGNAEALNPNSQVVSDCISLKHFQQKLTSEDLDNTFNSMGESGDEAIDAVIEYEARKMHIVLKGKNLSPPYLDDFPSAFREALKTLDMEYINQLQRCCWPQVNQGRNCFIIGGCKDTLSCLVPVVCKLTTSKMVRKHGPAAIILCASEISGFKIGSQLSQLIHSHGLNMYIGSSLSDADLQKSLESCLDVLICTPKFIRSLMTSCPSFFASLSLKYLIIDDLHVLLEDDLETTREVLALLSRDHGIEKTEHKKRLQFLVSGQSWNNSLKLAFRDLFPEMEDPILIIGSKLQAMMFGNIKILVDEADEDEKLERATDLIITKKHCVVVCTSRESVIKIAVKLYRSKNIKSKYFKNAKRTADEITEIRQAWRSHLVSERLIIIVTDEELKELHMEFVDCLINFEMPEKKILFADRHISMWDLFPKSIQGKGKELLSYIFLSPYDPELLRYLTQFKYMNAEMTEELVRHMQDLLKVEMHSRNMCEGVTFYGKCNALNKLNCEQTKRHFFTKENLDSQSAIPKFKHGRVDVQILTCNTLNHYTGLLHKFYEVDDGRKINCINYVTKLQKICDELQHFYSNEKNRECLKEIALGSKCALLFDDGGIQEYIRGKVAEVVDKTESNLPISYRIWCMDRGVFQIRVQNQLFLLPEGYGDMPPLTVNIIISNIKPIGNERDFKCSGSLKSLLVGEVVTARVFLSIEDTVWVNSLTKMQKGSNGEWVQVINARTEFLKKQMVAEENPNHLIALYELCEAEGYSCAIYKSVESLGPEFQKIKDPSWAFMPSSLSNPTFIAAWACYVVSPDEIYVIQEKFCGILDKLIDHLNNEILFQIETNYIDYESKFLAYFEEGLCVAAMDQDGRWARAIINKIYVDGKSHEFDVYLVDQGEYACLTSKDLFPIPRKFVQNLPFQAIALRLTHIAPVLCDEGLTGKAVVEREGRMNWPDDTNKYLQDHLIKGLIPVSIDVMTVSKIVKKTNSDPQCNFYEAYIFTETEEIGEHLVAKNLAEKNGRLWNNYETMKASCVYYKLEELKEKFAANQLEKNDDDDGASSNDLVVSSELFEQFKNCVSLKHSDSDPGSS